MKEGFIYKQKGDLTKQIFEDEASHAHALQMRTSKQERQDEKKLTVNDFKRPIGEEEIYDTKLNYLDQERLDKASINDLLITEHNFKINSRAPS